MQKKKKSLTYEELAVLAANGDDESMALLISAITPIAKAKGYALADSRVAGEDLTQEGMLGFLEAVKGFDPEKGGFKTKKDAELALTKFVNDYEETGVYPENKKITFNEVYD